MNRTLNHGTKWITLALPLLIPALPGPAMAAARAFPEAEGFGALATGGRGNKVFHVTTLADAGTGSLRDAVSQGNRIIVFDVGGVIAITSKLVIAGDNLTIAGQTAPGSGITVYGDGTSLGGRSNVVIRFVRFHQGLGSSDGTKTLNVTGGQNIILDHLSIQWGRWDCFGITENSSTVTLQDSIVGEGIDPQYFGALIDSADKVTIARTLWIDNQSRNPKFKANGQYINNVVYDWGSGGGLVGGHSSADWYTDVINNYFIAGPADTSGFLSQYASTDHVYQAGNMVDVDRDGKLGGRAVTNSDFKPQDSSPPTFETAAYNNPSVPVTVLTAQAAYDRILTQAGACQNRDAVDQRLIGQLRSLGSTGAIIADESAVGGQPTGTTTQRPAGFDTDGDGMSDEWETAHGLDPSSAADATSDWTGDGYTNIEKYLNELASSACGGASAPVDAGSFTRSDAAAIGDGARVDTSSTAGPDAGAGTDLTLARDAGVAADRPPPPPDTTGLMATDAAGPLPDTSVAGPDRSPDANANPIPREDAAVLPVDSAAIDSPPVSRGSDSGSAAAAQKPGCSCDLGSRAESPRVLWFLLGLALLVRPRRGQAKPAASNCPKISGHRS